jgi:endoglucanase
MTVKQRILILACSLFITQLGSVSGNGFLKVQGKNIVDSAGSEILLKAIGIGGWWLQEGYMFEYSSFAKTQHDFKQKIEDLVGAENTETFYDAFRNNFVTDRDIDSIASWGFNSIRLPMHYNLLISASEPDTFLVGGFQMIDSLLAWCKANQLYLILDLHGAPGGQGHDAAISDYDSTKPSLWESQENKDLTVTLWREIARRYASEKWIGGYDLINEPNWDLGSNNQALRDLYVDITNAIREVDTKHILFIEGNWFATDFKGLTPPWDDNLVYSFHKYWSQYNLSSIQYLLDIRSTYNVPLWLGETGENSNHWFTQLVKLLDQYKIGWACWPYKKTSSVTGHLTIHKPTGYQSLLNYWNGTAGKPSVDAAMTALMALTDSLKIENCTYHPDVNHAWLTFPANSSSIPFIYHNISGRIFCSDYDMGTQGIAYYDADYQNVGSGSSSWNSGGKYRNDGVDIEACSDAVTNGYNVGWTTAMEWLNYTMNVSESGNYSIAIRYAANSSVGRMHLEIDGIDITGSITLNPTGGWQIWLTKTVNNIHIESGTHTLTLVIEAEGFNLNYLNFSATTDIKTESENSEKLFRIIYDTSGGFIIQTNESDLMPFKIELYDLSGNCLLSDNFIQEYQMKKALPTGLYIVSLCNDHYFASQKIIVNNL